MYPDRVEQDVDTKTFTIEVSADLADRVAELAELLEQPRERVMELALTEWADREEYRHHLTLEGLEDVDAGRVVAHDVVMAWADSLATGNPLPLPLPKV